MATGDHDTHSPLSQSPRSDRRSVLKKGAALGAAVVGTNLSGVLPRSARAQDAPAIPEVPTVTVNYASLPAIDHTHIVIPVKRDWNKDVGLEIDPDIYGSSITSEKFVSALSSGSFDIVSGASVFALSGYATNDTYVSFAHGDVFQGFGFMVDPNAGYKSVDDFVSEGMDGPSAIKATGEQFRGKRLATLNEGGIRGFIAIAMESAGLSLDDIQIDSFDTDSKIIVELVAGRADFACGSAPGRISMTLQGFVPVLTSLNVTQFAEPSPDSKALRAIFHDGWATTRDYYAANPDTIFRFASMMYRTLRLMVDKPAETIPDHVDYYNSIAGASLTPEDVQIIYDELDPFIAYEDQGPWYDDAAQATNPFHYRNVTGSHIKLWEEQGVLEPGKYTPDNVSVSLELWKEFKQREANAKKLIDTATAAVTTTTTQAKELLDKAVFYQSIYDYLDAETFAQAAIDWAAHETGS